jgi:hypothetical protein
VLLSINLIEFSSSLVSLVQRRYLLSSVATLNHGLHSTVLLFIWLLHKGISNWCNICFPAKQTSLRVHLREKPRVNWLENIRIRTFIAFYNKLQVNDSSLFIKKKIAESAKEEGLHASAASPLSRCASPATFLGRARSSIPKPTTRHGPARAVSCPWREDQVVV